MATAKLKPRIALALGSLIAAYFTLGCSSLLYYPTRYEHVYRNRMPIKPEDVAFTSEDGTKLHGWYFKAKSEKPKNCSILFFHGNAQNLSTHFFALYSAPNRGYDYFIFDYRGYGHSDELAPSPETTVRDGKAALRWLKARHPERPIVVFGQSLGGAVALRTVIEMKDEIAPKAVYVDSTFSSYRAVGRNVLSKSWITWLFQPLAYLLLRDRWAPERELDRLPPIPLVVIHGDKDPTVDYSMGERLFAKASEPKEFWRIPGGQHTDFMWRDGGAHAEKFYASLDAICR